MPCYYLELKKWSMISSKADWNLFCDLLRKARHQCDYKKICIDFGTGSGGSALLMSKIFPNLPTITIDTFAGLPKPSKEDNPGFRQGDMACAYSDTIKRFKDHGSSNIVTYRYFVEKWVKDYWDDHKSGICAAMIDVNLFSPTKAALDWLKVSGRVSPGGIVVVDDVAYEGVETALNESGLIYKRKGRMAWIEF